MGCDGGRGGEGGEGGEMGWVGVDVGGCGFGGPCLSGTGWLWW